MRPILDSRQLLAMVVLARTRSFTLAGKELFLTQSAVSHAIKALENELETALFERTGRGVVLTANGRQFMPYAEKILGDMEAARGAIASVSSRLRRRLRLGVSIRARQLILPAVLPQFQEKFPNTVVMTEAGDFARHLDLLRTGGLDLAFSLRPVGGSDFAFTPLFEDELRFVVAPNHPWAQRGRVTGADLAEPSLILHPSTSMTPELLADYFRAEGLKPARVVELSNLESIRQIVLTGQAAGVMAPWFVQADLESGTLVSLPLGPHRLQRQWGLTYLREHQLTLAEESLIELCKASIEAMAARLQGPSSASAREKKSAEFAGLTKTALMRAEKKPA